MIEKPTFSIVIPVYNNERFLQKCIDSILKQTYSDFELLLIDDGSTDKSGAICDEYAKRDNRIRAFHQKNQGVSLARNKGIEEARGRYINFVDSDDWVYDNYLESYVRARKNFDYDVVYTEITRVFRGESNVVPLKKQSADRMEDLSGILSFLIRCGEFGYACNKSFKKDFLFRHRLRFDYRIPYHEDAVFMAELCLKMPSVCLYPVPTYLYNIHLSSQSFNKSIAFEKYYLACIMVCDKLLLLAKRLNSSNLDFVVKRYCQEERCLMVVKMYRINEVPGRKERLGYLKKLQDRFSFRSNSKGVVAMGLKIKNIYLTDLYFFTAFKLAKLLGRVN